MKVFNYMLVQVEINGYVATFAANLNRGITTKYFYDNPQTKVRQVNITGIVENKIEKSKKQVRDYLWR
jgi:hypothetical protein